MKGHGNNTVVGKFDMQTIELSMAALNEVQYKLFEMDEVTGETSSTSFGKFDAKQLTSLLATDENTVVFLQREGTGVTRFGEIEESAHTNWCITYWFGTCVNNRGLATGALYGDWFIANNPDALVRAYGGPSINITESVCSTCGVQHIDFTQRLIFDQDPHWKGAGRIEGVLHFRVERITDYINDRKQNQGEPLYVHVPWYANQYLESMRACYANQDTCL